MKPTIKLAKQKGGYYTVVIDGKIVGRATRSPNFMARSGYAGWDFKPNTNGVEAGLLPIWETTARRAAEASLRRSKEEVSA